MLQGLWLGQGNAEWEADSGRFSGLSCSLVWFLLIAHRSVNDQTVMSFRCFIIKLSFESTSETFF